MRTCAESFDSYILRSLGREFGAVQLPRELDITLCDQFFLIASGLIWNPRSPWARRILGTKQLSKKFAAEIHPIPSPGENTGRFGR